MTLKQLKLIELEKQTKLLEKITKRIKKIEERIINIDNNWK